MITQWQRDETIVGRLRVKGAGIDPALAQLRLPSLLNDSVSHPASLPSSAIIFVRQLNDPLPRSLRIQQGHIRPPFAWQQALNRSLENLVANAARPALGLVPSDAAAVVFLDRSELLAALAIDWCEGRVATRWWWQSLLKRATASQLVKEFWRDAPEYAPAALDKLSRVGRAHAFVGTFSDSDTRALLITVARTFALHDLASVIEHFQVGRRPALSNDLFADSQASSEKFYEAVRVNTRTTKAPWDDFVQTIQTRELGPEQQMLLGVSIMLQQAPVIVRTRSFANAVEAWSREFIQAPSRDIVDPQQTARKKLISREYEPTVSELVSSGNEIQVTQSEIETREFLLGPIRTSLPSKPISAATDVPPPVFHDTPVDESVPAEAEQLSNSLQIQPATTAESTVVTAFPESLHRSDGSARSAANTDQTSLARDEAVIVDFETETELGGLFYLINLGIYLGFYGDFTTPAEPGIDLNIWDFVALLGRELVGKSVEADPVWTVLRNLSGRSENEDPGFNFEPPAAWRIPPEWLQPFSGGVAHWWTTAGRLRLRHPAGFLLLDVAITSGAASNQLQRELEAYGQSSFSLIRSGRKPSSKTLRHSYKVRPRLRRWLDLLMPYVRARLQRALGLNEEQNLASILCRQRARLSVTETHIDVYMALGALPIEIRIAGLDRNPGWVPAAGRYINFHFE